MKAKDGQLDFNRNHPELRKGEIFLKNLMRGKSIIIEAVVIIDRDKVKKYPKIIHTDTGNWDDFNELPFKTKRLGKIAYAPFSFRLNKKREKVQVQIQTQRPVFVQLWEYKEKGFDLNYPFKDYLNEKFFKSQKEHYYEEE